MEQEYSDKFRENLAEFLGGDFELENLNCDEKSEKDEADCSHENEPTQEEDEALHQEGTGESELLFGVEAEDETYSAEDVGDDQLEVAEDGDGLQGVSGLVDTDRTPEVDYGSSDGGTDPDGAVSQEDEDDDDDDDDDNRLGTAEKPGHLLMSDSCDFELHSGDRVDEMFSEETPPDLEEAERPQGGDEEEDDGGSDDYMWRYERFPNCGDETMTKSPEYEQKVDEDLQPELFYSDDVGPPAPRLEDVESPYGGESACFDFPSMSSQSLQDLVGEGDVEKMKEFSGEEHEEAGESFADYPSDFSSCEYVGDGFKIQGRRDNTNNDAADAIPLGPEEDADEQEDGYLYSRDLEMDAERMVSFIVATGDKDGKDVEVGEDMLDEVTVRQREDEGGTVETLSKDSSEDEVQDQGERDDELSDKVGVKLEDTWPYGSSATDCREDADWDYVLSKTASLLSDQLITEDAVEAEVSPSDLSQSAAGDSDGYSVEQREIREAMVPPFQGSVDDSFFFNTGVKVTELGQMEEDDQGDEQQEDERSREPKQERINAFFEFYNNSEAPTEGEERQIKVQFCTDPLSQVISYHSDSSDVGSLSSSSDEAEDLSSAEAFEELKESDEIFKNIPSCTPSMAQLPRSFPENKVCHTKICSQKHKCLRMLTFTARMGVMVVVGLLMFWWTIGQPGWLPSFL